MWLLVTLLVCFIFTFAFVGWWAIAATFLFTVLLTTIVVS